MYVRLAQQVCQPISAHNTLLNTNIDIYSKDKNITERIYKIGVFIVTIINSLLIAFLCILLQYRGPKESLNQVIGIIQSESESETELSDNDN